MAYIIPQNSFIQALSSLAASTCHENISLCFPVFDRNDVSFQFIDSAPGGTTSYSCGIYRDGAAVGSTTPIYFEILEDDTHLVIMPSLPPITTLAIGDCFNVRIFRTDRDGTTTFFETNCFTKIDSSCWTSRITYRCEEDSFGFIYTEDYAVGMSRNAMYQTVRLPFYLKEPQFPVKRNVFLLSNGARKKLSARVSTEYEAATDYMPKDWHEKLVIAMEHDQLVISNIDSGFTNQSFSQEGAYDIDWQKFLDYPTAPAKFKLFKTPYYNVNSNCS